MKQLLMWIVCLQTSFVFAQEINLVPLPMSLTQQKGVFTLDNSTRIISSPATDVEALQLKQCLTAVTNYVTPIVKDTTTRTNIIQLRLNPHDQRLAKEGYHLSITPERILIQGVDQAGLFYGIQTLRQLLPISKRQPATGVNWILPCVEFEDRPTYPWRAMMLDVSRYFFDKEYVKRYLDIMAMHKLNVLHLHLVDDPGWRLQIKAYPKLTQVGAFRGEGAERYGGYYTQEDMREIIAYAAKLHISIVPEIELPAHIQSALASYAWLGCSSKSLTVPKKCYISREILCAGKESTYQFLEDVLSEVVELFPAPYIHIGGDEAKYDRWQKCEHCQKKFQAEDMQDFSELQGYMTRRIEAFLLKKQRRIIGWDEITNMGLSPNAAVMTWHRPETAVQAARAGNKVVMALTKHAYFDTPESKLPGEPPAATWLAPISLQKAYNWDPTPMSLKGSARNNILGAHGCVWTDQFMHKPILQDFPALNEHRSWDYVEYLSLPRMAALAEVTWTPKARRSWSDFEQRMKSQYRRYSLQGYNYRVPLPIVKEPVKTSRGYKIIAECPVQHAKVCYTTDGTYPNAYSQVYSKPVWVEELEDFRAVTVIDTRQVSLAFTFPPDERKIYVQYGELVGRWKSGAISTGTYASADNDITGKISQNGRYQVTFIYTGGRERLDIEKVEIILHGKVVAVDTHYGTTGSQNKDNTYTLHINNFETGANYTLRAYICGDTGNDSNGLIFMKRN